MKQDNFGITVVGIFLGYILAFVLTFGHAYHQIPRVEQREFANETYTVHNGAGIRATGAFLAAMFWPLYWSVKVWE